MRCGDGTRPCPPPQLPPACGGSRSAGGAQLLRCADGARPCPPPQLQTAQRRARARTRERRQDLDGEQDGAARAVAGAEESRRKQTRKRDEIVTPGPNRGGYLGKDSRPIARNPKYGEAGASPVRGISTGLSPCQLQQQPRPSSDCNGGYARRPYALTIPALPTLEMLVRSWGVSDRGTSVLAPVRGSMPRCCPRRVV